MKKGLTLVELIVVIAILAVFLTVLVPTFVSYIKSKKIEADNRSAENMATAMRDALANEGTALEFMDYVDNPGVLLFPVTYTDEGKVEIDIANRGVTSYGDNITDYEFGKEFIALIGDSVGLKSKSHAGQTLRMTVTIKAEETIDPITGNTVPRYRYDDVSIACEWINNN